MSAAALFRRGECAHGKTTSVAAVLQHEHRRHDTKGERRIRSLRTFDGTLVLTLCRTLKPAGGLKDADAWTPLLESRG